MTGKPLAPASGRSPPPIDAGLLEKWALSYLGRYAASAEALRRVLHRRAWRHGGEEAARTAGAAIESLLVRYRGAGLLNDRVFAEGRAATEWTRGRPLGRIAAALAAKGVAAEDTEAALQGLRERSGDPDLVAAGEFARRRRLGPFRAGARDPARDLAAFARAGFRRREAEAVLRCPDPSALAALLAPDDRE